MNETKQLKEDTLDRGRKNGIKGKSIRDLRSKLIKPLMTKLKRDFENLPKQKDQTLRKESIRLLRERYNINDDFDLFFDKYRQLVFYYFHQDFGIKDDPNSIFFLFAAFEGYISNLKRDFPRNWLSKDSVRPQQILNMMIHMIYHCEKIQSTFEEFFNMNQSKGILKEEMEREKSGKFRKRIWRPELMTKSIRWLYRRRKESLEATKRDFKEERKRYFDKFMKEMSKQGSERNGGQCTVFEMSRYLPFCN